MSRKLKQFEDRASKRPKLLVFSFQYFDINQGQSFENWEEEKILSRLIIKLKDISNCTMAQATSAQIIKPYPTFPPNEKTEFLHPKHVPAAANWASLHIDGKRCVIGCIEENVFHIVFLDKDHRFWISEKKHT